MASTWLDELNPAQRQAVTFGDGPLLVVAGAGTGKTKTLACRVAWLVERGVDPSRILLLTFTRRAAAEMIRRAQQVCAQPSITRVWGGTFHAVANRLLRIYGQALQLPNSFTVMDQGDAADLMGLLRDELGLSKRERRFPKKNTLVRIYSHTVNAQQPLSETLKTHFPWCSQEADDLGPLFERYGQRKAAQNLLDYDDLLLYWRTLCNVPGTGVSVADRFEHILVDEYQDTNHVQAEILRGMRKKHGHIMAVGDDAQSIYSFRAATIRNILDFPKDFPGAEVVTLEENYRSTQPILTASNAVMEQARERYTKELWSDRRSDEKPVLVHCTDESEQTGEVCRNILQHRERDVPLMQQAVLFRAGHHSADLEIELARRNIPFHKYGGLKFIETAHIKDVLALLRILENPYDEISWFRVLQLLPGIGPRLARRIMDALVVRAEMPQPAADGNDDVTLCSPLTRLIDHPPPVPPPARECFAQLRDALCDCGRVGRSAPPAVDQSDEEALGDLDGDVDAATPANGPTLPSQIERLAQFYRPICERLHDNPAVRLRDLEQLGNIAQRYRSRRRFITDLTLDPPSATSDLAQAPHLDEDYLVLSTMHSAKG
ncbi:MAG: ATP-dependent helicase, partial [Planctomycetes bacterium]|nr:ATP-dependent helicase [Planctomycetota bacterium]